MRRRESGRKGVNMRGKKVCEKGGTENEGGEVGKEREKEENKESDKRRLDNKSCKN